IVSRTRVMLTTAGPFALYGNAIVDACVRFKTHYADITGETTWVRDLIDRYHNRAAADGTRIIPICGFDSVPSDLGTYLTVRRVERVLIEPCNEVQAYLQVYGGVNGGPLALMFKLYDTGHAKRACDPFLLSRGLEHSKEDIKRSQDPSHPRYAKDVH